MIVFKSNRHTQIDVREEIYVMNSDLTPTFSDNGQNILYLLLDYYINDSSQLIGADHRFVMLNADGSNPQQLLPDDRHTSIVEWCDW